MEAASHVAYPPTHPAANKPKQERPPTAADHTGQQQFYHPPHLPPPQPQNPFQTNFHRPPPPMQSLPSFMPPHNQMEEEPPSAAPNPPPQEADNIVLPHPNARPFLQDGSLYYVQKLQKPYMPPQGGQVNPGTPPRGEAPLTDGDAQQNKQLTPNQKDMIGMYAGRSGFERTPNDKNGKRKRNEGVEQAEEVRKERHNMAEKKRRSDMNDAIERLRALLPQQVTAEKRLTKVEVLIEAADHLTQVQNLCAKLIAENNGMKGAPPPGAMPGPDTRPPISVDAVRGRNPVNEEEEEEESEEDENDGEEDDYRRKDADQNGRVRKDAVAPPYAQMHHQHRPEGDKVEDVGGRGMEHQQHMPQQMTQQMTQQMPPQHLQQHQHQPQQMPQPQKGRDRP